MSHPLNKDINFLGSNLPRKERHYSRLKETVMKEIKLTQGQFALIDDDDYERVNQFKWYARYDKKRNTFTALTNIRNNKKQISIYMHRAIMNATDEKILIDHINHNTLDNRKENLRLCSVNENNYNRKINKNNNSGYKGVHLARYNRKNKIYIYYRAKIQTDNIEVSLGLFKTAKKAAIAYNEAAKKYHGEFAYLNPIT